MNAPATPWLRAMPAVFVLIWSTGFIVARLGMPHAPPMSFLALRYALSIACFLPWIWLAGVRWPEGRAAISASTPTNRATIEARTLVDATAITPSSDARCAAGDWPAGSECQR